MVKNMQEKSVFQVSQNDMDIIMLTDSSYCWEIGENLKNHDDNDESDEQKNKWHWPDALAHLEIVTVTSLNRGLRCEPC